MARFCFLSEEGQFEYDIEYNEDQGDPNLLLYYDTNDQWPAVYKSNKVSPFLGHDPACRYVLSMAHVLFNKYVYLFLLFQFLIELKQC